MSRDIVALTILKAQKLSPFISYHAHLIMKETPKKAKVCVDASASHEDIICTSVYEIYSNLITV